MKIRNRLTLTSSLVFGIVYTIASVVVYIGFKTISEIVIFNQLEKTCNLTALFYLEEDELPQKEHEIIRARFQANILSENVRVFNALNEIEYGKQQVDEAITPDKLDLVRNQKKSRFKYGSDYYFGIYYPDNQGNFVIFISDNYQYLQDQSNLLLLILVVALVAGLTAIVFFSRALSNIAYRPVVDAIKQVNAIEPESLSSGKLIESAHTNDELQDLIDTLNNLLKRLSDTFLIQKNFINYVSHELKTPLAAISGNMEVFAQKSRSPEEHDQLVKDVVNNVYQIEGILNTLMFISGLKKDPKLDQQLRIDETIWNIVDKLAFTYPSSSISVNMHIKPGREEVLTIKGNALPIQLALYNIIENALKFSMGKPVDIVLAEKNNSLELVVQDYGKGIPRDELKYIDQPFFRGSNVQEIKGNGIGLSLAVRVFNQNNIVFNIESEVDKWTKIILRFEATTTDGQLQVAYGSKSKKVFGPSTHPR
jgi:two-component system, OmpR family, sensor histidine kinase ArlS